jgi:hypothetical protein
VFDAVQTPAAIPQTSSCLNFPPRIPRQGVQITGAFKIVKSHFALIKRLSMNNPARYSLFIILGVLIAVPIAGARPVDFKELSLLVRAHESDASIKDEVSRRKLMQPLTSDQESKLKSQGASDSLVSSLRSSSLVASKEEAATVARSTSPREAGAPIESMTHRHGPRVHVFNVAFGHPVNLSEWGGLDYEIAFNSYRFAGEDHIQAGFVDPIGTRTTVSRVIPSAGLSESEVVSQDWFPSNSVRSWRYTPYDVRGDVRDGRFSFNDTLSVSSQSVTRPTRIDWDNPIFIEGQPYTFYPVYGAGGVSLYYIGRASDSSATVAVVSHWH